jgi:hypothetical protein
MNTGDKAILVPGISNMKHIGSSALKSRVAATLRDMTEEVTIVKISDGGGNSKVQDQSGKQFYCNTNDLSEYYDGFYNHSS